MGRVACLVTISYKRRQGGDRPGVATVSRVGRVGGDSRERCRACSDSLVWGWGGVADDGELFGECVAERSSSDIARAPGRGRRGGRGGQSAPRNSTVFCVWQQERGAARATTQAGRGRQPLSAPPQRTLTSRPGFQGSYIVTRPRGISHGSSHHRYPPTKDSDRIRRIWAMLSFKASVALQSLGTADPGTLLFVCT